MPLETPAKAVAERLLMLTEALRDAVENEKIDEFGGLFQSRQQAIEQLGTMDIDAGADALLKKVADSESALMDQLLGSQAALTNEMIKTYSGARNVQAYQQQEAVKGFQRTG